MNDDTRETLGDSGKEHCNHCAGEALVDPSINDQLQSMRKDAARYEFLREHWAGLICHTDYSEPDRMRHVTAIEQRSGFYPIDLQSLDQAIDAAMEREEENERSAAIGDQQDDLSGPAVQRRGIDTAAERCVCNQGVFDQLRPGMCARCGKRLRRQRLWPHENAWDDGRKP